MSNPKARGLTERTPPAEWRRVESRCLYRGSAYLREEMVDAYEWQCGDCHTLIEGPETRKCPNCGGINFYPLADEVPGDGDGTVTTEGEVESVLDRLDSTEE